MTPKRYVLLQADADVQPQAWKELATLLEGRFGRLKAIPVAGNDRAMIVRTDNFAAPRIRECEDLHAGTARVRSVLTSGSIGKLKRLAGKSGGRDDAKVPE